MKFILSREYEVAYFISFILGNNIKIGHISFKYILDSHQQDVNTTLRRIVNHIMVESLLAIYAAILSLD